MITIVAAFSVNACDKAALLTAAKELIEKSREEEGNVTYNLYEDISDPAKMTFIEEWRDQAAIDYHNSTEHFNRICAQLGNYTAGPMKVNLYTKTSVSE